MTASGPRPPLPRPSEGSLEPELHVAFASDQMYFHGLLVAAASVAFFADRQRSLTLHVLDGGIVNASWQRLVTCIARIHPRAICRRIVVDRTNLARFRDNGRKGPMVYARLLLPELVAASRVVYVDCDFLVLADLHAVATRPMGANLVLAVQDPMVGALGNDCPWLPQPHIDPAAPYFNSGFLVVDLGGWRESGVAGRALALLARDGPKCTYWDQTVLNYVLAGKVGWLDRAWNFPNPGFALEDAGGKACALHYLNHQKPWLRGSGTDAHALWRAFAKTVARLRGHELKWRVWRDEARSLLLERNARLLAAWYDARVRAGHAAARLPAAYWRTQAEAKPSVRERAAHRRVLLRGARRSWRAALRVGSNLQPT